MIKQQLTFKQQSKCYIYIVMKQYYRYCKCRLILVYLINIEYLL